jgi:FkbM family methyltransferase
MLAKLHTLIRHTPWLGRLAIRAIPDLRWQISVAPIGQFEINLRRNRGFWLRPSLQDERFMLGALQRLIHPGDVVYDLGANIGLYSRCMVQRFQASKVYAFEPMSQNLPLLQRNLEIGGCTGSVIVMRIAIGDQDGTATFQVDDFNSNSGTLDAVTHGGASQAHRQYQLPPRTEVVQVGRMDTVIQTQSLMLPGVIKIDIEGAEAMALRGARKLLTEHQPRLVIELHGPEVAIEVLQILWECNYHCFGFLATSDGGGVYKKLTATDLAAINHKYALHFMVASCREEEVRRRIDNLDWVRG